MLSYQHAYHAGSPADLHKHAILAAVAARLAQKPKPFSILDVFAGEGIYDLTGAEAAKTGEHKRGISAVWAKRDVAPPAIAALIACVRGLNYGDALVRYPGSPHVLKNFLREDDRFIVNELHPAAAAALRQWARNDERVAVHMRDGLEALTALVPPKIRRGLAVIDPSYEIQGEYAVTGAAVAEATTKWPEGIFAVWYPILADNRHLPLLKAIDHDLSLPALTSELMFDLPGLADSPNRGIRGSGVAIVNPPWQIDLALEESGAWLARELDLGPKAAHSLRWIHPQR